MNHKWKSKLMLLFRHRCSTQCPPGVSVRPWFVFPSNMFSPQIVDETGNCSLRLTTRHSTFQKPASCTCPAFKTEDLMRNFFFHHLVSLLILQMKPKAIYSSLLLFMRIFPRNTKAQSVKRNIKKWLFYAKEDYADTCMSSSDPVTDVFDLQIFTSAYRTVWPPGSTEDKKTVGSCINYVHPFTSCGENVALNLICIVLVSSNRSRSG